MTQQLRPVGLIMPNYTGIIHTISDLCSASGALRSKFFWHAVIYGRHCRENVHNECDLCVRLHSQFSNVFITPPDE